MYPNAIDLPLSNPAVAGAMLDETVRLPMALRARMANIVYTAQVQMAYACATNARRSAECSVASIEKTWPDTPLRTVMLDIYRSQARSADTMAREVLAEARRHCGLAYAGF